MKVTDFMNDSDSSKETEFIPTKLVPKEKFEDLPIERQFRSNLNEMGYKGLLEHQLQAFGLFYEHPISEELAMNDYIAERTDRGIIQEQRKKIVLLWKTSAGKTLIAMMFMHRQLTKNENGRVIYCVPYKALAEEMYEKLKLAFRGLWNVEISTGEYTSISVKEFRDADIVIVTYHKLNSLLRNDKKGALRNVISCVVFDELHMVDTNHGFVLEDVVNQLKTKDSSFIALSATIGKAHEVKKWLSDEHGEAVLCESDFRPVELERGVFIHSNHPQIRYENDEVEKVMRRDKNAYVNASVHFLEKGMPTIMFRQSKANTQSTARSVAEWIRKNRGKVNRERFPLRDNKHAKNLKKLLPYGCAYHHSGMLREEKKLVEDLYREGKINFIASTTGLSTGVNLPASAGIIEYMRYDGDLGKMAPIPKNECLQCLGRIGRPQYQSTGVGLILLNGDRKKDWQIDKMAWELHENYFVGGPDPVKSTFYKETNLIKCVLGAIAGGYARNEKELMNYVKGSLSYIQNKRKLFINLDNVLGSLLDKETPFISIDNGQMKPTKVGKEINRLYIHPETASVLIKASNHLPSDASNLSIMFWACLTPDFNTLYPSRRQKGKFMELLYQREDELCIDEELDQQHINALMTSSVLVGLDESPYGWIQETEMNSIENVWKIDGGELSGIIGWRGTAGWIMSSFEKIAGICDNKGLSEKCKLLRMRLKYGIKEELVPLVRIKGVGKEIARRLYDSGFKTVSQVANADVEKIARISVGGRKLGKDAGKIIYMAGMQRD